MQGTVDTVTVETDIHTAQGNHTDQRDIRGLDLTGCQSLEEYFIGFRKLILFYIKSAHPSFGTRSIATFCNKHNAFYAFKAQDTELYDALYRAYRIRYSDYEYEDSEHVNINSLSKGRLHHTQPAFTLPPAHP
jgi:hypothetical protein